MSSNLNCVENVKEFDLWTLKGMWKIIKEIKMLIFEDSGRLPSNFNCVEIVKEIKTWIFNGMWKIVKEIARISNQGNFDAAL